MANLIDRVAKDTYKNLEACLTALENRSRRRGSTRQKSEHENAWLDLLLKTFKEGAQLYFAAAEKIISQQGLKLDERSRAYFEVTKTVGEHARLLSDITRPFLDRGDNKLASVEGTEDLIAVIARRVGNPIIVPISSQNLQYVHFNYMQNFGVIGIPPFMLAASAESSPWNFGLLWHEVGGYAIALVRRQGRLEGWAEELKGRLGDELGATYKTIFEELPTMQELSPAQREKQFKDEQWRVDWLGEFFEDLFGIQVTGASMIGVLTEVLVQRCKGDEKHPPPALRLEVALAWLDEKERYDTRQNLAAHYDLEQLRLRDKISKELDLEPIAQTVVKFYKEKVGAGEFSQPEASQEEKDLAKNFRLAVDQFLQADGTGVRASVAQNAQGQSPPASKKVESRPKAQVSNNLWASVEDKTGKEKIAIFFLKEVNAADKKRIEETALQLEDAINKGGLIEKDGKHYLDDGRIEVIYSSPLSKIAAIVVDKDVTGLRLFVNDLVSLLKVEFAEKDDCCWNQGTGYP